MALDPQTLTELAQWAGDVAAIDGGTVSHVEMSEAADGSRRALAVVTVMDGEHEQTYRVLSPAPWNSPAWAAIHKDWTVEVRTGETWLKLEVV